MSHMFRVLALLHLRLSWLICACHSCIGRSKGWCIPYLALLGPFPIDCSLWLLLHHLIVTTLP